MDAEDIRIAHDRIALAGQRLQDLRDAGIDAAGLASQLDFARTALEQGRTLDVLALCEEVLLAARRLRGPLPAPAATPTDPPTVRTERRSAESYPSGVYAPPATEALDRHKLTEEIRQVVQSDMLAKAMTGAQLQQRIGQSVENALANRFDALRAEFDELLDRRFQSLAATPETRSFAPPAADPAALAGAVREQVEADVARRLAEQAGEQARLTATTVADGMAATRAALEARLAELADPQRIQAPVAAAIEAGLARLEAASRAAEAERRTLDEADGSRRDADLAERLDRLRGELGATIEERFQRLAAGPETTVYTKPPDTEALARDIEARLVAGIEQRLEARSEGMARQAAQTIAEATTALETRLAELTDPQRVRRLVDATIDEGLARIELARQESAARRAVGTVDELVAVEKAVVELRESLPTRVAEAVDACLPARITEALAGVTEAVAAPVRDLVAETLNRVVSPDLDALAQRLGSELREDLAWQVERLGAERGWVSLADVRAELVGGQPVVPPPTTAGGFARLEAALVEFVNQTQSQQQQFLGLLQRKVVESTAIVSRRQPAAGPPVPAVEPAAIPRDGETGLVARATDATDAHELGALESNVGGADAAPAKAPEGDLDVLTKSAQYRAIAALGDQPTPGGQFLRGAPTGPRRRHRSAGASSRGIPPPAVPRRWQWTAIPPATPPRSPRPSWRSRWWTTDPTRTSCWRWNRPTRWHLRPRSSPRAFRRANYQPGKSPPPCGRRPRPIPGWRRNPPPPPTPRWNPNPRPSRTLPGTVPPPCSPTPAPRATRPARSRRRCRRPRAPPVRRPRAPPVRRPSSSRQSHRARRRHPAPRAGSARWKAACARWCAARSSGNWPAG